jgi:hypothetical protein
MSLEEYSEMIRQRLNQLREEWIEAADGQELDQITARVGPMLDDFERIININELEAAHAA